MTKLADAFRLAVEHGALALEFGTIVGPAAAGGRPPVRVTDRILLPATTAQRLLLALDAALLPHAAGLRAAAAQALPPEHAARLLDPAASPAEVGQRMRALVAALGAPFHYEASFRISPGALDTERFLLTLNRTEISGNAAARCLRIAAELGMPPEAQAAAEAAFGSAANVHFGFEGGGAPICKLYLERGISAAERTAAAQAGQAVPLHVAFKWDRASGRSVTSRYLWHPDLPPGAIAARLMRLYAGTDGRALALAQAALHLAAPLLPPERMQYLEVIEDGTPRRSFDLNLYGSGLLVRDAQPALAAMRDLFGIRPGQFQALMDRVRMQPLGHVAGGLHRTGAPFFNIYSGAARMPPGAG